MKIDVITLFPKMFESPFAEAMMKRAIDKKILELNCHDMRKWAWNSYGSVDDKPYGGDVGMLIRVDVVAKAINEVASSQTPRNDATRIILTSARGKKFTQQKAQEWSKLDNLIILCGRYEGFDARISNMVDEEISIGDYVLTGGEIPAMVMIDAVTRLLPGVLGKDESSKVESHSDEGYIEFPQYTRPQEYNGKIVPKELISGDPKQIRAWQLLQLKQKEPV